MTGAAVKKKKEKKSIRTRKSILDVALRLFQERGFDETTMRDIAREADLSVGAAYYYFKTKDEFVLAFYEQTLEETLSKVESIIAGHSKLADRLIALMEHKYEQMTPYKNFISVIVRNAAEPGNPLSPFSSETKHIRDRAIELIQITIEGSTFRTADRLVHHLPMLLWFHHMSLIFFWIHDPTKDKRKSMELAKLSSKLLVKLLGFTKYRMMAPLTASIEKLLDILEGLFGVEESLLLSSPQDSPRK